MKPTEAAALLTIAAAFDNRKPDADAAKAWALALADYRFEDAREAVVAHYREGTDWIMPSHVVTRVKRIRAKRLAEYGEPDVPSGLEEAEYRAYLRDARRAIADGDLTRESTPAVELPKRNVAAAIESTFRRPEGGA